MDQDATCMEVGLGPGHTVLDEDPAPPQKGGTVCKNHKLPGLVT